MNAVQLVIAIPAYNEEAHIVTVVRGCLAQGAEVWVLDDGSIDRTSEMARQAGAYVIRREQNTGKGVMIRIALEQFLKSSAENLILMDADGQHDPAWIPKFIEIERTTGAPIVVGNRMEETRAMPWVRYLTNRLMSWMVSLLSGQKIPDSQCGFRLITRAFATHFRPSTTRFDLESEMLIQAKRLGMSIASVPIPTIYRQCSSHIRPLPDTVRFLRLILHYLRCSPSK